MELLDVIRKVVYDVTGKDGISQETDFVKDLGLTSFDVMNIVCAFEDMYDIEIPTRDVWQLRQAKDVVEYMKSKGVS
ncbi:MAG TPA: acyl carrier protein [Candidatus Limivivens intestinipullorum]|uniref:Acyl carrier protein n=1 Tax=Candidatus Limivivens intestinipullorum TaxID=2840858 RepID=A0A9D1EU73_9FIRM|nr:acyl carrier protein [Candidatus Limivivens intestinipullorum]